MTTVSVIMPVYNVEAYVAGAMDSVLAQTFLDFELLVVDDGGPDRSVDVCRSYSDPRIRIIAQPNRGLAGARNTGIREARGRFLAFLDADDLWQPDKLARHVAHLEDNPGIGVSYSQSLFIDDYCASLGYLQAPMLKDVRPRDVLLRNPVGNGSAPVIRREVFDEIRFLADDEEKPWDQYFDESFRQSEDIECWIRIALTTRWGFAGIGEPLTLYRVNAGGLSANIERQFATWERMIAKTATYAPEFVARWGGLARAFQLRYAARRCVRSGDGKSALMLLRRAFRANPGLLVRSPVRTLVTLGAAVLQNLLPHTWYSRLEQRAMAAAGRRQRLALR